MSRRRTTLLLAGILLLGGCGPDPRPAEPDVTPDEAYRSLESAVRGMVEEITTDGTASLADRVDTPCGGLGGNERTQVRGSLGGGAGLTDEGAEALFDRVRGAARSLGLSGAERRDTPAGPSLGFTGDGFVLEVQLRETGAVFVSGETACLADPEG